MSPGEVDEGGGVMVCELGGYAGGGHDLQREEGVTCSFSGICLIIIGR